VVTLTAYNQDHLNGVSATARVQVVEAPVHYVALNNANPVPPYTSWATAATNIQDAVDAAAVPGALVLVTNGVYATGGSAVVGRMTNRVVVSKVLTLRSVNGPQFTVIQGAKASTGGNGEGAIRCVYLTNGASLSGFTLSNGATRRRSELFDDLYRETSGGGVWCQSTSVVVSNCVLTDNSAGWYGGGSHQGTLINCTLTANSAQSSGGGANDAALYNCMLANNNASSSGGGVIRSTLINCLLTGNSATEGGGALSGTLVNCTLAGNAASSGGGAHSAILNNCIVYSNTGTNGANYSGNYPYLTLNYCCTTPLPPDGVGNITNAPLFVDYAGGNLRLQSNSPCINAGLNAYAPEPTDVDGLPRIVSGTADIGAYEFQGSGSAISYAWLQHYGLPTDGSADATDLDADGHNTWQEWRCLTDPTNAISALRLLSVSSTGTNVTVSWQSVAGVSYCLERSTDLTASPPFTPLAAGIPGQLGTTSFTDTSTEGLAPLFYRVVVQ
jgi:hypothetical protein